MPKYGDIIKQAKSGKPDSQTTSLPDSQSAELHQALVANQVARQPDSQVARQPDGPMKNLCVKVPESWRRHWAAQAKLTGRTMTDVMVEALTTEFGLPDNQTPR
ncbi:hypothetical protein [Halomicronema sp. CCY15110]|uniref:hypothetical protein n=1 Tax=Halomicronema sp. CCY15110 TaxID=2767773 RepID=UPI00194E72BB|nr:hypothetical protein [Halomicronema sp. CCY15110]